MLPDESFYLLRFQNEKLLQMKAVITAKKTSSSKISIVFRSKLIVIDCQDLKLFQAVQTRVTSAVEDSVKEQFKFYSDDVWENFMVCKPDSET